METNLTDQKQTVYLIDDDAAIRRTLPRGLKRRGLQVEVFDSAKMFLVAYQESFTGCIVLDLSMAGMNGLELQQELLNRDIRLPIIFITGHGSVPESVRALRAGAIDFLEKPFSPEILQERIEEAFEQDLKHRLNVQRRKQIRERFERLTERENQVLELLLADPENASSKSIGLDLDISHRTVEQHRARIHDKTRTNSLNELVSIATQVWRKPDKDKPQN